uniref:Uncharacterized protein n=1 Tax=Glossina pallidipes TaxID=7398 RepID=A0A1B0AB25_GLOPL
MLTVEDLKLLIKSVRHPCPLHDFQLSPQIHFNFNSINFVIRSCNDYCENVDSSRSRSSAMSSDKRSLARLSDAVGAFIVSLPNIGSRDKSSVLKFEKVIWLPIIGCSAYCRVTMCVLSECTIIL